MSNGMDNSLLDAYLYEENNLLDQLDELLVADEKNGDFSSDDVNEIFRIMHTIKGCLLYTSPQKGSPLLRFPHGFYQLQVSPGGGIDHHILACGRGGDGCNMFQGAFLCLIHVLHHGPGGDDACGIVLQPQSCKGPYLKMLSQDPTACLLPEKAAGQGRDHGLIPVF